MQARRQGRWWCLLRRQEVMSCALANINKRTFIVFRTCFWDLKERHTTVLCVELS